MIDVPAPIAFYLKHQEQIDEWASLAKEVPELAHRFYKSLEQPLRERAKTLAGTPLVYSNFESSYCKLLLTDPSWGQPTAPRTGIGLEWAQRSSGFKLAYTGVWVSNDAPGGKELHAAVVARVATIGAAHGLRPQKTWWPQWRYETPSQPDYWGHLDEFSLALVGTIAAWWDLFNTSVDAAIGEVGEAAPSTSKPG